MKLWLATLLLPLVALAQQGPVSEFPAGATVPTASELTAHLSNKSFRTKFADGTGVQTKFSADGALSATVPGTGYYDTGTWRVEDGKLCGSLRKAGSFCNDARMDQGVLYLRRMNGEVVRYDGS